VIWQARRGACGLDLGLRGRCFEHDHPCPEALPLVVRDGWPESIEGTVVTFYEAGLVLGGMGFDPPRPSSWPQDHGWLTVRIDAHQTVEEWKAGPPRRLRTVRLHVPVEAVLAPESALRDNATFGDWINSTHGFSGRLLVWDVPDLVGRP
jgi:hypothetical protein